VVSAVPQVVDSGAMVAIRLGNFRYEGREMINRSLFVLLGVLVLLVGPTVAFAQRDDSQFRSELRSEEFSGETLGTTDGGLFGTALIVALGVFIVIAFILDKYFRFFIFAFAGMIVGMIAIFDTFDKQGRVIAILVVMAALLYADRQLRK